MMTNDDYGVTNDDYGAFDVDCNNKCICVVLFSS